MSDAPPWTALQYYHRARENGDHDKAKLWLAEARKRGEVVDPSEPRSAA
jgi:hypothetical protein